MKLVIYIITYYYYYYYYIRYKSSINLGIKWLAAEEQLAS